VSSKLSHLKESRDKKRRRNGALENDKVTNEAITPRMKAGAEKRMAQVKMESQQTKKMKMSFWRSQQQHRRLGIKLWVGLRLGLNKPKA
jgi:hypothetical protein